MLKLWFSLYDRGTYEGVEPAFYNPNEMGFSKTLEDNFVVIKNELNEYLKSHQLQSYFNSTMVEKKYSWKTISLKWWGIKFYNNYKFFPNTLKCLSSIDGLMSASFNLLHAGGKIVPHCGDTNGIYRIHLGIEIPEGLPNCGFRVRDEWRSWEEGKLLIFVDAVNHEAINVSNKDRFIMSLDVIKPEFKNKKNYICSVVLTSLFLQNRAESFGVLYKLPLFFQKAFGSFLVPFAYIAFNVRNVIYYLLYK